MKNILSLLVLISSLNAWSAAINADRLNKNCRTTYRTATLDMINVIEDYNNGVLDAQHLSTASATVSGEVFLNRTTCLYLESPTARACSDRYKEVYTDIRSKVSAGALLIGTQKEVEASKIYLFSTKARLAYIDLSCE